MPPGRPGHLAGGRRVVHVAVAVRVVALVVLVVGWLGPEQRLAQRLVLLDHGLVRALPWSREGTRAHVRQCTNAILVQRERSRHGDCPAWAARTQHVRTGVAAPMAGRCASALDWRGEMRDCDAWPARASQHDGTATNPWLTATDTTPSRMQACAPPACSSQGRNRGQQRAARRRPGPPGATHQLKLLHAQGKDQAPWVVGDACTGGGGDKPGRGGCQGCPPVLTSALCVATRLPTSARCTPQGSCWAAAHAGQQQGAAAPGINAGRDCAAGPDWPLGSGTSHTSHQLRRLCRRALPAGGRGSGAGVGWVGGHAAALQGWAGLGWMARAPA